MNHTADGYTHQPVLLEEAVIRLAVRVDGVYVDATYGRGGHSREILRHLGAEGRLIAMDRDPQAVAAAQMKWNDDRRVTVHRGAFSMLERIAQQHGVCGQVNGVLLDLGLSSAQLADAQRGFSFLRDGPLDMRMDPESGESAAHWVARATPAEIVTVIQRYGEERFARRIARAIAAARARAPITRTQQLADIVSEAVPTRERRKHPATRTFQALRIYINRELDELAECLDQCLRVLAPGGRLVVISFHSLEDRLVKRFMRAHARAAPPDPKAPWLSSAERPSLRLAGKPTRPQAAEIDRNPRARSAVLRTAERLA
ncbi:MAG: 16S rRNA (cytosine(1402)-N(4))-methyltransferase RsmH [Gammaproteobacteria bacterium]|nr:16S rRNA (cytosine(1402)-N(4))-methyltransferase RsmH [Gammaproteobacteria bacterium]